MSITCEALLRDRFAERLYVALWMAKGRGFASASGASIRLSAANS